MKKIYFLADPVNNLIETLEKRALKNSTSDIFDCIITEFKEGLKNDQFKENNSKNFKAKKRETNLMVEVKPEQIKYNNLKNQWRKSTDMKKTGSA